MRSRNPHYLETLGNMTNNIVSVDQAQSPFDSTRRFRADGSEYWDARELMSLMGYVKWQRFETPIKSAIENLEINGDNASNHFLPLAVSYKGQEKGNYELTRYAAYMTALCCDGRKPEVASAKKYFALKTREAEVIIPAQSDRLLIMQLENENLRLANENMRIQQNILGLQNDMLCLHGAPVVLALAGRSDQVVEIQKEITVIVEPESGKSDKIMTAEQLKKFVTERTGQKLPSLKWFADKLRQAGRDDLLIPVTRHSTNEYPKPDFIDEAMQIIYGKERQKLIGEN